tara:strand:- start:11381 stop:12517 length:1137 start_codon:yes stop_codon:yes gene_type:complete
MKFTFNLKYLIISLILFSSCKSTIYVDSSKIQTANSRASVNTKLLLEKVRRISNEGIAVGHQDPTAYGIDWVADSKKLRNDIDDVVHKMPAIHGWDFGKLELDRDSNIDNISFDLMRQNIIKSYKQGAITTFSWHLDNPRSGGDSWDTTSVVPLLLHDTKMRDKYKMWVAKVAAFLNTLKDDDGKLIPIIFRPYHEMNGSWFWWGASSCTPEEYKILFQDLVRLMSINNVRNCLFAYSPNTLNSPDEYEKFYPGDKYVDILGIDIYNHGGDARFSNKLQNDIAIMRDFALKHDKPFALTETGNIKPENPEWFTQVLYPGIKDSGIAWLLFWRNAKPSHYFATYPGEIAEKDFKDFAAKEDILFLREVRKKHIINGIPK